jgi:hypothetical protein
MFWLGVAIGATGMLALLAGLIALALAVVRSLPPPIDYIDRRWFGTRKA